MITVEQIRAARALIGWGQADLAERTGLSTPAIGNVEIKKHKPTLETQAKIIRAFDQAGVEFIDDGVRKKTKKIEIIRGEDFYVQLLDDVFHTLKDKKGSDVCISAADEKLSSGLVNHSFERLKKANIRVMKMIEDGNHYILGDLNDYRFIPKPFFKNKVSVIYGDKVAYVVGNDEQAFIIKDENVAATQRNIFQLLWRHLKKPEYSEIEKNK